MLKEAKKNKHIQDYPSSKSPGLTPMMEQYLKIKENYSEEILFYRMGDFYEMFFHDAKIAASVLDITLTKRGMLEDSDIPMCGIPFHSADNYLRKLLKKGFRVAICEQIKSYTKITTKNKAPIERKVVRVITPGTTVEENYLDDSTNNFLCSWSDVSGEQSISWVDLSTGIFFVEKIDKNLQRSFETSLERLSPLEVIMPNKMKDKKPSFYDGCITFQADSLFQSEICEKRLKDFYNVKSLVPFGDFSRSCISAAGAILGYINLTQKGKLPLLKNLVEWKKKEIMEIDIFSRKSLELVRTQSGDKKGSLFNCINNTITSGGSRMMLERLNSPLLDKSIINKRLDTVENFIKSHAFRSKINEILKQIPDIERALTRLQLDRGGPRDLLSIKIGVEKASEILSKLSDYDFKYKNHELENFKNILNINSNFIKKLDNAIIDAPPLFARDGNFIKTGFYKKLDKIKKLRDSSKEHIVSLQKEYADKTDIQSLKIKYNNVLGYHIEIRRSQEAKINNHQMFMHRQSTAQASRYTSTDLVDLEVKLLDSGKEALEIELKIFDELVSDCLKKSEYLLDVYLSISKLDVSIGLADLADTWDYCRPEISDQNIFSVTSGRHPVVEQALQKNSDAKFIGNDCQLEEKNLWLITGPNMGGKSTFLRQNALINILAQMGSFVPAKKAKIGITDRIFSRLGSGDDLSKGQSTFMIEMIETASILNQATKRSFVILDEIGRGTATWDGLSLAWSITENIHNKIKCKTLFATHYHELTKLDDTLKNLCLFFLEAKEFNEEIIFLYKVIPGSANKSYGLQVAKLAGVPYEVIERAETILENLEDDYNIETKLPLFSMKKPFKEKETNLIEEKLVDINPDDISPIEALKVLYELKKYLKK